ncbi:peptidoglycan-binding protein [Ornithinimicrobium cavernae]|uniref:peptidoglycan-binding protein n=1 Tax=Ornithinimicrobium cavernae TaxID=2666047 RepID=UPI0012B184CB|nr:peptidoglycan-binding protein [Ornithinimicrobium cavernae]
MTVGGTPGRDGARHAAGRHREFRRGAIAVLEAALAISMTQFPVWAEGEPGGSEAPADPGAPPEQGAPPEEGTAPEDPGTPPGQGSTPPADGGGLRYGGRSLGPAPLETLPADPAYPVPEPPTNEFLPKGVELPEEVDEAGVFQSNVICDPVAKPGVIAVANLLGEHYDRPAHSLSRSCIDQRSEHYDGRAVDWTLNANDPHDRRIGDAAVTWLTDNDGEVARRLGIQSIIWNHRAWHASDTTWRAYVGQSAHTDHVHISLNWDGAFMRTSWWTGVAVTAENADQGPCAVIGGAYAALPQAPRTEACAPAEFWPEDTGYATVRPGGQGEGVGLVQPLLDVEQTGVLDDATREALLVWQGEQGVPQTGVLDQLTYAAALGQELPELPEGALAVDRSEALTTEFTPVRRQVLTEGDTGEAVKVLQDALGVDGDGIFGPLTAAALTEFAEEQPLLPDDLTATDTLVWHLLEQEAYPHLALRTTELEIEDTGHAVEVLQELLGVEGDGIFGPITQQAVLDAQAAAELEQTGVVDAATWKAIDEAATARAEAEAEAARAAEAKAKADAEAEAARVKAALSPGAGAPDGAVDDRLSASPVR